MQFYASLSRPMEIQKTDRATSISESLRLIHLLGARRPRSYAISSSHKKTPPTILFEGGVIIQMAMFILRLNPYRLSIRKQRHHAMFLCTINLCPPLLKTYFHRICRRLPRK